MPAGLTPLAVVRAVDGATMVCAARDPGPLMRPSDAVLAEHFDREMDEGVARVARGPG